LTLAGVAFALGDKVAGPGALGGELAILAAAATGALCSVLYRPYLRRYPTLPVSASRWRQPPPRCSCRPRSTISPSHLRSSAAKPGPRSSSSGSRRRRLCALALALKSIAATRVTVFLALSADHGALAGAAFLGEPLTFGMIAGSDASRPGLWWRNREWSRAKVGFSQCST